MKDHVAEGYVQIDELDCKPFPEGLAEGGITWKLLNVSPEMGAWTAIFDCPAGSSFALHIHMGPGEYFLTRAEWTCAAARTPAAIPPWRRATATNRATPATTRPIFPKTASSR